MAQGAGDSREALTDSPEAIRAEMGEIRRDITRKVGELKRRLLGRPTRTKGKKAMAAKQGKAAGAAKKPAASRSKAATKKGGKESKALKKTKEVIGDVLAGAAKGAAQGALEAAAKDLKKATGAKKKAPKGKK